MPGNPQPNWPGIHNQTGRESTTKLHGGESTTKLAVRSQPNCMVLNPQGNSAAVAKTARVPDYQTTALDLKK